MTDKQVIEAMYRYLNDNPSKIMALCNVQHVATYNIHKTKVGENIIKRYKPTWRSKFWWQSWNLISGNCYWWPLTLKGMQKRRAFIEHLLVKLQDHE